ncbi:hypothetical protein HGRIS_010567 [Hohenbuehelia grisea]|uniref:Carboxylesterase type B domain-containing protein n=1 Tax=Hohenbuehelia grisea TaxID=104357 RepID=A0ABR3IXL5_9AGAR
MMQSGSPISVGPLSGGQKYFDQIVSDPGVACSSAEDKITCLRTTPYANLTAAINKTPSIFDYQSLALAWLPRVDGTFLTDNPVSLVTSGKVANVPLTGDCQDEGTIFSFSTLNISNDTAFASWVQNDFIPGLSDADMQSLALQYPSAPDQGSPYGTGISYDLTSQYKRIASLQGDAVFQAPRRFFLQQRSGQQPSWSFLSRANYRVFIGAFHGGDLVQAYQGGPLGDYFIDFVNSLDPNGEGRTFWPQYTVASPTLLVFPIARWKKPSTELDDYRVAPMTFLTSLASEYPA